MHHLRPVVPGVIVRRRRQRQRQGRRRGDSASWWRRSATGIGDDDDSDGVPNGADLDGDEDVDIEDLAAFLSPFGGACG